MARPEILEPTLAPVWRDAEIDPPENGAEVLAFSPDSGMQQVTVYRNLGGVTVYCGDEHFGGVTHWARLPEAPNGN